MNHVFITILIYLSLVLQTSFIPEFSAPNSQPNLFWLCLLFAVFQMGSNSSVIWSAGIGLAAASVSGIPLGVEVICFSTVCFLLRRFSMHEIRSSLLLSLVSFISFCVLGATSLFAQSWLETGTLELFNLNAFPVESAGTTALLGFAMIVFWKSLCALTGTALSKSKIAGNNRWKPFVN